VGEDSIDAGSAPFPLKEEGTHPGSFPIAHISQFCYWYCGFCGISPFLGYLGAVMRKGTVLLDESFKRIGDVAVDERKRVSLTKALDSLKEILGNESELDDAIRFGVYVNDAGQVLLSPEVSVPMHELWLYKNPRALKTVLKGLEESREGKLKHLGSFEKYADDDIE